VIVSPITGTFYHSSLLSLALGFGSFGDDTRLPLLLLGLLFGSFGFVPVWL
jgi:hypothetical protein